MNTLINNYQQISIYNLNIMMRCQRHSAKSVEYVCTASTCDYLTLCNECRKQHIDQHRTQKLAHISFITPISKILQTAEDNLRRQKRKIQQLVSPFEEQQRIRRQIQQQKESLKRECESIKNKIQERFTMQIIKLQSLNDSRERRNAQDIPLKQLADRRDQIQQLENSFRQQPSMLKKSIHYDLDEYMRNLARTKHKLTSIQFFRSNEYYLYDHLQHQFYLSTLEPKKKIINGNPLTRVSNQSPLYFLITNKTSDTLFYFSSSDNHLRTFNVHTKKWKAYRAPEGIKIPQFGCSLHDYDADTDTDKFYLFGGGSQINAVQAFSNIVRRYDYNSNNNKKNTIICFDRKKKQWFTCKSQLNVPRSSAMCVLIKKQQKKAYNQMLIVGGLDSKGVALKSCELFTPGSDPKNGYIQLLKCDTNFGTSSGTLVNFNNNIIIKLGGLGNSGSDHAICEMAEKLDFEKYRIKQQTKWNYIQIEDILGHNKEKKYRLFYASQSAIQINPNQILVFGGYSHQNEGVKESYILEIQTINIPIPKWKQNKQSQQSKQSSRYYARMINQKPLITGEGFGDLKPILWQEKLYTLQNISSERNKNVILQKEKKILQFNMFEWSETDCVITQ